MARSTEEPQNVSMAGSTEEPQNVQWLWLKTVMEDHPERRRQEPPIQKVHPTLRQVKTNETYFVPKVVSLGPYHHGKGCNAKPMDYLKEDAVRWFISFFKLPNSNDSNDDVRKIYEEFVEKDSHNEPLKHWYADNDETIKQLKDEDFKLMMFVDGCFILYIVHKWLHDFHQPFILSDMFLLENQIPYRVLKSLMNLMPEPKALEEEDIEMFILENAFLNRLSFPERVGGLRFGKTSTVTRSTVRIDIESLHLLDILRTNLILRTDLGSISKRGPDDRDYVPTIMELKAKGIKIHKSHFNDLSEIKFKEGLIHGYLSLPQMIIDGRTRPQLLNLIAYEMCSGFPFNDSHPALVITSYVCFLDCLIHHAGDVKELRLEGILRNRVGSDEEVAKLFNEVATNLIPDPRVYGATLRKIQG